MFFAALAVNTVIAVAYLAIFWTIARNVLVVDSQWRSNPLAVATAAIFFSCGVGHGLHATHLVEHGSDATLLFDPHVVAWDLTTAFVATWYWSLRNGLAALGTGGQLFEDARIQERAQLAEVLQELFDGVHVLPARDPDLSAVPDPLRELPATTVRGLVEGVGADGRTRSVEARTSSGAVLEVRASRWTDSVVLAWRDVTELREAQRARADVEAQLAAAFDAAPVAMLVLQEGRVLRGNRALHSLTGGRLAAGAPFSALFPPDARQEALERLGTFRDGSEVDAWEAQLVQEDGRLRWAEVSLAAVADGSGDRRGQVVAHLVDVEDRKAYEEQLRHLADHDPLTGLVNRRRLDEELRAQCARTARGETRGALLLIDLDHFKEVNDTLGHAAGDRLLVGIADVLRREVRAGDVVARLGGDEFAVLSPTAGRADAVALADRLCAAVREHARGLAGATEATGRVTCSLGLTLFAPGDTPESALVAADLTLYDAKEGGRDRTAVYSDDEQQPRTKSRLQLLDRLRRALEQDTLAVLAQPVVDLRNRAVQHVELLLRLPDADGGLLPPSAFLHLAEQSDLVCEIDVWMTSYAVRYATRTPSTTVCVNVSGRSLSDPEVVGRLERLVRDAGLPPGSLMLEVTETAAVEQVHTAREGLERLRAVGCLLALDDFGSGFAGLSYVKHLPFDVLKIDGQFVSSCRADPADLVLVDAVVSLARGLGKTVVAEHVEDEATALLLLAHGVQQGQGFHLGPPRLLAPVPRPRSASEAPGAVGSTV
ncbi:MAG: hypothetical protein JWO60_2963 [Frankiales bacterium]|nr:hypothetical protein [Frankiales bacterium]